MQAILNLQIAHAHYSAGDKVLASNFVNTAVQIRSCISSFPGVSCMQMNPIKLEPVMSFRESSSEATARFLGLEPVAQPSRHPSQSIPTHSSPMVIDEEDIKPSQIPLMDPSSSGKYQVYCIYIDLSSKADQWLVCRWNSIN